MSKRIGEVLAISGVNITVEVDPRISDLHVRHTGKTYTIGQPGSYLIVDRGHDKHLILVTTVRKTRWNASEQNVDGLSEEIKEGLPKGNFPYLPTHPDLLDRTLIDGILVGTIIGKRFEIGITHLPVVGDEVAIALQSHLAIALAPEQERFTVSMGTFVDSNIPVYLDMDDLFGKHAAIVGTTGCGKSYTVARLLQEIVSSYPGANIVVFDLHGEYRNCFTQCNYMRADQLSLPAWLHSFDNLFDLCADLSNQFNIHNQRWAFREGIFKLKQRYCENVLSDQKLANNIDLDSPIPFNFRHLVNYLKNINNETKNKDTDAAAYKEEKEHDQFEEEIEYKAKERNKIIGGTFNGELDRLVLRVESRFNDPRYAFMFNYEQPKKGDLEALVRKVTGFVHESPMPITVYDLSYLPSETVGAVVATISRIIFQIHFLSKRRAFIPTLIVYEEAHNYISYRGRGAYGDAREAAERISKEGRKFGIGMLAVSQRPSELSETMLSQCNTFLCMRLANSVDKNHILSLLPDSMNNLVDILPILPRGHVLVVGQATKMPVRTLVTKVKDNKRKPDSDDPPFGEKWNIEITSRKIPDIKKICDKWIRSEKLIEE
ncbi:MAG: AAA-like domain protein [Candidatus Scalindua rubra]|uniref:AAA-like domain protein n=1 Tax=Candidatus Scalindua rubra TaxID=1872076 RepID=A0A1E3XAJ6_9BACT|nr:MAG: AAA-like domain protein [Candidatus Scalindua rubra]